MRAACFPLLVAAILLPSAARADQAQALTALRTDPGDRAAIPRDLREKLEEEGLALAPGGESDSGRTTGYVIFDAPIEVTWLLLSQTERQTEYRGELKEVRRLAADGHVVTDEHRIRVMFLNVRYALEYRLDPEAYRLEWRLAEGEDNQLEHVSGSWKLSPLGLERTLGRFETSVRVGKALPRALQDMVTRSKVPKTLEASMEWVNEEADSIARSRAVTLRSPAP